MAEQLVSRFAEPAWLSDALRGAGALPSGAVAAVALRPNPAFNSQVAHLSLSYTADAPPGAPRAVLLKTLSADDGEHEVGWYRYLAGLPARPALVPPCYLATVDEGSNAAALLLADLSATHAPPVSREQLLAGQGVPAAVDLGGIMAALAALHAAWWEHPDLDSGPEQLAVRPWYRDEAHFRRHVERRRREWAAFSAAAPGWLPGPVRERYGRALAELPELWDGPLGERVSGLRGITVTHGDCYLTQWLCPRAPGRHLSGRLRLGER